MSEFGRDFLQAVRTLRRAPGFSVIAITVFALGIGATTAIFTLLQRVVLDPLPYPESGRLVRLKSPVPGVGAGEEWQLSPSEQRYFSASTKTLDAVGAFRAGGANVATPDGAQRVRTALASGSVLRMLGARPLLGRLIADADDAVGAAQVVVLSEGFWRRSFGGDRSVVGRTLSLNERPVEIVGVMARGTYLPEDPGGGLASEPDLWQPFVLEENGGPFSHIIPTLARLAPGFTVEQAQQEMNRLTAQLGDAFPEGYSRNFLERYRLSTKVYPLKQYTVGAAARNLWILFGSVALILVIACLNVANLFLVRVETRRRELAVRSALGAGRLVIARQFLAESLAMVLAGCVVSLALGWWGVDALVSLAPDSLPRLAELRVGSGSVLFALGISLLVALVLALFPILHHRRDMAAGAIGDSGRVTTGRERQRLRDGLVALQVALALVLVIGAGLLVASYQRLRSVNPGVDARGVLTMQVYLPESRYPQASDAWRFYANVLERIEAIPGVTRAGASEELPFTEAFGCTVQGFANAAVYERLRNAGNTTCAGQEPTTPGYFEALGIPLLSGRTFTRADNDQPEAGAVVVSKSFADRFWPGEDAVGKRIAPNGWTNPPFYTVVGVVGDVYSSSLEEPPAIVAYYPIACIPGNKQPWSARVVSLAVRTSLADPASVFSAVRKAVADVDPAIPLSNAGTMSSIVDHSMGRLSFTMTLLGLAAFLALLLAAIGLYGVISWIVTRRTRELGVRVALGARPRQVAALVIGNSLRMVLLGAGAGTIGALALTGLMRSLLFGVQPTNPLTYAIAISVLAGVSLLASWLPARRAARVDPLVAMRTD